MPAPRSCRASRACGHNGRMLSTARSFYKVMLPAWLAAACSGGGTGTDGGGGGSAVGGAGGGTAGSGGGSATGGAGGGPVAPRTYVYVSGSSSTLSIFSLDLASGAL